MNRETKQYKGITYYKDTDIITRDNKRHTIIGYAVSIGTKSLYTKSEAAIKRFITNNTTKK